jgi:hypothetical protein
VNRRQLDRAVARATGESLRTVRERGFGVFEIRPAAGPERLTLVADCPHCRRPVPYPGRAADGSPALAECTDCDLYFEPRPETVYDVTTAGARAPA